MPCGTTWDGRFSQVPPTATHFVLFQRHVDFDSRVARNGRRNAPRESSQIQRLLLPRNLIQQLVQHALDRRRIHSRRRDLHRNTGAPRRAPPQIRCAATRRRSRQTPPAAPEDASSTIGISSRWLSTLSAPRAASGFVQITRIFVRHVWYKSIAGPHSPPG